MKSVGEVMGIGRNFTEALQKACQSLENGKVGLGADGKTGQKHKTYLIVLITHLGIESLKLKMRWN